MSLTKRTTKAKLVWRAIFRQIGAGEQADRRAQRHRASTLITTLPKMALESPPAMPGGGVDWVKSVGDSADTPP